MRIKGHENLRRTQGVIRFARGDEVIELLCTALPLTYSERMLRELPLPRPQAIGWMHDTKGRLMKDEASGEPLVETNEQAPEFMAEQDRSINRRLAYRIWLGLADDPNVAFDVDSTLPLPELCDKVLAELDAAGFGALEVARMASHVAALGGAVADDVDAAKNGSSAE